MGAVGALSALVPRSELARVRATAARLHRSRAATPRGGRLGRRICFVVAAIAPHLPPDRLAVLVRHAIWAYRLDDRLDRPGVELGTVARVGAAVGAVAAGGTPQAGSLPPDDPLLAELARTRADLLRFGGAEPLVARFGQALREVVAAELAQARRLREVAAGAAAPPTAERYLALAARTVNYRSFAYALLALGGHPAPAPPAARRIGRALRHAARAVRLGNDLRGAARNRSGEGPSILGLRTAGGAAVTRQHAVCEIDRQVRAHDRVLAGLPGDPPPAVAQVLRRSLRVSVDLYRHTDLR